nr:MAG TPA: hypothetical protein [Caudoviricetes sp.]
MESGGVAVWFYFWLKSDMMKMSIFISESRRSFLADLRCH